MGTSGGAVESDNEWHDLRSMEYDESHLRSFDAATTEQGGIEFKKQKKPQSLQGVSLIKKV